MHSTRAGWWVIVRTRYSARVFVPVALAETKEEALRVAHRTLFVNHKRGCQCTVT